MFCGSCMHDNTWARSLMRQGVEVSLVPTYTPLRLDEADVSGQRIFFGGINVYLASKWRWWRVVPGWLRRILDRPRLLAMAARRAVNNDAAGLGPLTLDMLAGEVGPMREQVEELAVFLAEKLKPDIVIFSNALLAGVVGLLKLAYRGPVHCLLQGDDIFLNELIEPYRSQALGILRGHARQNSPAEIHRAAPGMGSIASIRRDYNNTREWPS